MTGNQNLKIIGSALSFAGGIVAFFASISYFFEGNFMPHFDYNRIGSQTGEPLTIMGVFVFIIAIIALVSALLSINREPSRILFINLIILGALLLASLPFVGMIFNVFASFTAGLLILAGGILGDIGSGIE
jgi:hypothetical protein